MLVSSSVRGRTSALRDWPSSRCDRPERREIGRRILIRSQDLAPVIASPAQHGHVELRSVDEFDMPFLAKMAVLASFPPGQALPRPEEAPPVRRWVDGWGQYGDIGVVARVRDERAGAAWARIFREPLIRDEEGEPMAEVAIAVDEPFRNRGIGTSLLSALARATTKPVSDVCR